MNVDDEDDADTSTTPRPTRRVIEVTIDGQVQIVELDALTWARLERATAEERERLGVR